MTKAGRMKIMEDRQPAAEACVCTVLFSRILAPLNNRSTDIEMTAAGMADEKVRPTFRPRNTLEAVKTIVIRAPNTIPRAVSSGRLTLSGIREISVMLFFWFIKDNLPARNVTACCLFQRHDKVNN